MAGFSTALAQSIFNATLAASASQSNLVAVGAVYISLHTSAPSDQAGTDATELADPASNAYGYARAQVDGQSGRPAFTGSEVVGGDGYVWRATNSAQINFPAASTNYPADVTHWGIWKHATSRDRANLLYSGAFTTARTVQAGDVVTIGTGEMDLDLT